MELVWPLLGVGIGLAAGWYGASQLSKAKLEPLEKRATDAEAELKQASANLASSQAEQARLEERATQVDTLKSELAEQANLLQELREEIAGFREKKAELESKVAEKENALLELRKQFEDSKQGLTDTFKALSSDALKNSTEQLAQAAEEILKRYKENAEGDLSQRQKAIETLLKPMQDRLKELNEQTHHMELSRKGAYHEIAEQIKNLGQQQIGLTKETTRLVKALQDPGSAGSWGEMVLQRVIEMAGLNEHVDYEQQVTTGESEARQRPDAVVRLPGDRILIIDSKSPAKHYLEGLEEPDERTKQVMFATHAAKLYEHSKELKRRDYSKHEEAPDFTVMFIPSESAFRVALEARPALLEEAMQNNVVIATPSTLLALLRAVAFGWRQEKLAQNAKKVQDDAARLYDSVCSMMEHYTNLGKALTAATKKYNEFGGSLESRVLPAARKFKDHGVQSNKAVVEVVEPVEFMPRPLQSSDFSKNTLPGLTD